MANKTSAPLPTGDISELLHALRTRELGKMPPGAKRFLSAGCSGSWYFRWIADHYPTAIESHVGVEAFSPEPEDLPENVSWIPNTAGEMRSVPDKSVDLVFAGQTVEHVWPPDLAGFLLEAHRVLEPGGWLVFDSPNRLLTHPLQWIHPQHTAELTALEVTELAQLAGFEDVRVRGIWLCRDRDTNRLLSLNPDPNDTVWSVDRRASLAAERPDDSFIWWAEARKAGPPQPKKLQDRAKLIYDDVSTFVFARWVKYIGEFVGDGPDRVVRTVGIPGQQIVCAGPNVPLRPGKYSARVAVRSLTKTAGPVAAVDGFVFCSNEQLDSKLVLGEELEPGMWHELELPLDFAEAKFGVQIRWFSMTDTPMEFRFGADLRGHEKVPVLPLPVTNTDPRAQPSLRQRLVRKAQRLAVSRLA